MLYPFIKNIILGDCRKVYTKNGSSSGIDRIFSDEGSSLIGVILVYHFVTSDNS